MFTFYCLNITDDPEEHFYFELNKKTKFPEHYMSVFLQAHVLCIKQLGYTAVMK